MLKVVGGVVECWWSRLLGVVAYGMDIGAQRVLYKVELYGLCGGGGNAVWGVKAWVVVKGRWRESGGGCFL